MDNETGVSRLGSGLHRHYGSSSHRANIILCFLLLALQLAFLVLQHVLHGNDQLPAGPQQR